MNHFRSAVYGDWEDVTVLSGDADVDDGGTMAFQNPSWFPKKENKPHCFFFFNDVTRLKVNPLSSGSSPREMWVPHAYQSVHASSDQQAVLLTEVERLDAFVDAENCLVEWRPELWSPAQLDLLGLTFVAGLSDLTQLLLGVRQRQHTTSRRGKNTKLFITRPRASIKKHAVDAMVRHYQNKRPRQRMDTGDPEHTHTHRHAGTDWWICERWVIKSHPSQLPYQAAAAQHQV